MTLKHTPATALPFHAYSGDGEGWHIGNAGQRQRGEAIACTFDEGHPARAAQDAAYLAHTSSNYPLMVGALKSAQVVPENLDRLDAETLRRFIREQADVAAETLRKVGGVGVNRDGIRVRGVLYENVDVAYDEAVQREVDEAAAAQRAPCGPEVLGGGIACTQCSCGGKGVCRDAA